MAVIRSRYTVNAPSTNLLSYIFDSLYKEDGAWPSPEPLLISAKENHPAGYSINQIESAVKRIGCGLHHLGAKGKRVMVYGGANIHFTLAVLGIIASGGACSILPSSPVYYLVSCLRQLQSDIVLFAPRDLETVCVAAAELDTGASSSTHLAVIRTSGLVSPSEAKTTTAVLLYTSGTTGTSKIAERTHHSLIGNIEQTLHHYTLRPRKTETILCNYRFFGMGFLTLGILIPLKARYKTVFPAGWEPETFTQTIERLKPSWVIAPKHLMRGTLAMGNRNKNRVKMASIRHVITGGAIIPYELVEEWQRVFGSQVQSTYGMTEAGFCTIPDPNEPVENATTGILLANIEAKVVDNSGKVLARNQKGDIYIRTPFVMKGYLDDPEKTAETITEDGWIKTGDIGWVDEQDRFYIVGRRKDLLKIKGHNVTAAEIETAMLRHPELEDVAVIPITLRGEEEPVPRGYVVKTEQSTLTLEELTSWMRQELPQIMQLIGGVAFIDAIPISNIGNSKVDRQRLCEMAQRELQHGAGVKTLSEMLC